MQWTRFAVLFMAIGVAGGFVRPAAAQVKSTPAFKVEEVATNLSAPWSIAFLPDGRVWVTERAGRVREIRQQDGKWRLIEAPVLIVPDIKTWLKMGLLGIALDPAFESNRFVYLAENYELPGEKRFMRIARYREKDGQLVDPQKLIDGIPAWWNHTGGRIKFGPDRKLYITTGDADKPPISQDLFNLGGKILRLNPDGTVPSDNPFVGKDNARPEIWTWGHRNPQGITWQQTTGILFEAEHGPDGGDEINIIRKSENYGWPVIDHDRQKEGMVGPLLQYTPSIGPADATFYDADLFPSLKGDLLIGMMRGEGILRVQLSGSTVVSAERLLHQKFGRIREVAVAPDGAIWITTSEIDPPDGRNNRPGFDKVIRLTPDATATGHGESMPTYVKAVGAPAIYAQSCAGCHGQGQGSLNSSLFDGKWLFGEKDEDLRRIIHDGKIDRGMPKYGDDTASGGATRLTPAEIEEMVKYIRQREAAARK